MEEIPTLGGTERRARGLDALGEIVGHAFTAKNRQHAFLIDHGPMQDLNDLIPANSGWELTLATEVTDDARKIIAQKKLLLRK
jgi:probable HAF family extracellular repeat protein